MPALEIDGTLIDPTLLTVSEGKLAGAPLLKVEREAEPPPGIWVSWQNDKDSRQERLEDSLMAVTFAQDHFSAPTDTSLERGDQSGTFTLLPAHPVGKESVPCFYSG